MWKIDWVMWLGIILVILYTCSGCSDPVSRQVERDQRQDAMNSAGADYGCPPGETYYPGAGSPWYIEPTPGGCSPD